MSPSRRHSAQQSVRPRTRHRPRCRHKTAIDPVEVDLSYTNGSAAWTAWGTYLWADGTTPRVDGLVWQASDFQADGTHPGPTGVTKVVNLLMTFYLSSPYTPWFRP